MTQCRISRRDFLAASFGSTMVLPTLSAREGESRRLLMIAGTPSHGPGDHEFNAGTTLLKKCLDRAGIPGLTTILQLNGWPKDESVFHGVHAIFLYCDGGGGHPFIQKNRLQLIGDLMKQGVGLMCAHYAVEVPKDRGGPEFKEWIGGYYEHQYSVNPIWVPRFEQLPDHPICRGVEPFAIRDEWYFNMRWRDGMKGVVPILTAKPSDSVRNGPYVYPRGPYKHIQEAKGRPEAVMWAVEREDGGRGVGFTGGHFHVNWSDPNFRKVVLNALLWITKIDVPKDGVPSTVTEREMAENLDPKGKR
jgi:type 1 glutamine amidotransferase